MAQTSPGVMPEARLAQLGEFLARGPDPKLYSTRYRGEECSYRIEDGYCNPLHEIHTLSTVPEDKRSPARRDCISRLEA